ncbi:hypothetical protein QFC20_007707 [Naganishia adeliensis]|uniref:Uncharacterized protein n=1 Tax=Naganishia adeliensis TaxID=92952 RepID=A0ACC2UWE9_9TREE|nr:hypothetical protein QFC20_007707 [Naganishia adeliensis]
MKDNQWIETFQRLSAIDFEYFLNGNSQWGIRVRQQAESPMTVYALCWRAQYELYFNFAFYQVKQRMVFTIQGGEDQGFPETTQRTVILSSAGYDDIKAQLPLCLNGFSGLLADVVSGVEESGGKIELQNIPSDVMEYLLAELRMWLMAFMYKVKGKFD